MSEKIDNEKDSNENLKNDSFKKKLEELKGPIIALAAILLISVLLVLFFNRDITAKLTVTGTSPSATALKEGAVIDPVYIYFNGSATKLEDLGQTINEGIYIDPPIKGSFRWQSEKQITFTPEEDWTADTNYKVTFDKTLFPEHIELNKYSYNFKSAPFTQKISSREFYHDPIDKKIKRAIATVQFSHGVDTIDFTKNVKLYIQEKAKKDKFLKPAKKPIEFTVSFDKFKGKAFIQSIPLAIPLKDSVVIFEIKGGTKADLNNAKTTGDLHAKIDVPGMYTYFRVTRASTTLVRNEEYEPEQVIIFETTDGVLEETFQDHLEVYRLPKNRPIIPGKTNKITYNNYWGSTSEIGPEVLNLSTRVDLTPIPTEKEYSKIHSFKYNEPVGSFLYFKVRNGLKSRGGYILANTFDKINKVQPFPKELEIMHDGSLLTLSGAKGLNVLTRGIDGLKFEIARILPGQINHLVTQTNGDITDPHFKNWNFSDENISEFFEETVTLNNSNPAKANYTTLNLAKHMKNQNKSGLFRVKVKSWNPRTKRTTGRTDKRLIMITNMGLVIKDNSNNTHDVFVMDLSTSRPKANVKISVLGKNGLAVLTKYSDANGHVKFPDLKNFKKDKTPVAYIATYGNDISFIPYNLYQRKINYSRFNTGGVRTKGMTDKLDAYLFSDRGIYRPGDKFNIAMVVKSGNWAKNITNIPLEMVLTGPRRTTLMEKRFRLPQYGFHEMNYTTSETSPTGNYTLSLYIVKDNRRRSLIGSTTVKVEEFIPDRMRISTSFSEQRFNGWVSPEGLKGQVSLKNLFGTPAENRKVAASITLSPSFPSFKGLKDYRFFDPMRAKKSFDERLKNTKTDKDGFADFDLNLKRFEKATYRLNFLAEGFEAKGGRGVVSESSVLVSPLKYLIGFKTDGDLRYINKNAERKIELIAVDNKLDKVSVKDLKAKLVERRYVSSLLKQPNGLYKYESIEKLITVSQETFEIGTKGKFMPLKTDEPGDYALVIEDLEGTELNKINFSIIGKANLTRDLEKNAELKIKLNKRDFSPGEEVEVYITAPYTGAGLITVERDKVYTYKWFKTNTTSSMQKITVPNNIEGNGYINVTFVRSIDSKEIYMSPLSYAVEPFTVSRGKHDIKIKVETLDLVLPGEPLKILYKSEKPGKAIIFAIDEGILQVAKYSTPDPLEHFFKKRALEVGTSQILDLLLPEIKSLVNKSSYGGGSDYGMEAIGKNLNPFKRKRLKPIAFWSGIVNTDSTEREVTYDVPEYFNGTLRVMAVAISNQSIGATEKKSTVRGHFVLTPNVPTFVSPEDTFKVSLGIANNLEGSGEDALINIKVDPTSHLQIADGLEKTIKVSEGREGVVTFDVTALKLLGAATLKFTAQIGSKKSSYTVGLSVRPPSAYMTDIKGGHFKKGPREVPVERDMYKEYRTLDATVSSLPLVLAKGLNQYLSTYPYGCTEQLVSKAFPAIILKSNPAFFNYTNKQIESRLNSTISILRSRQNSAGSFGFWTANHHVNAFVNVYAAHFLTEAKERGFNVPKSLTDKSLNYLRTIARTSKSSLPALRVKAYAIYILTRNQVVTTGFINSLLSDLDNYQPKTWRNDLTALYLASSYKMLKHDRKAEKMFGKFKLDRTPVRNYNYFYDSQVREAMYLYLMSEHFSSRLTKMPVEFFETLSETLTNKSYNTTSSAMTILALSSYSDIVGTPTQASIGVTEKISEESSRALSLSKGIFQSADFSEDAKSIIFDGKTDHYIFYSTTEAGFDKDLPVDKITDTIEIQRDFRDEDGNIVEKTKLGTEVEVHLKVRTIDSSDVNNVALVDLLPGGFEVVRSSIRQTTGDSGWRGKKTATRQLWKTDNVDIREDRIVVYGTVTGSIKEFVYRIKAINEGTYSTPPAFGASMYDNSKKGRSLGSKFTVTEND